MYVPDITLLGLAWHKSTESSQNGGCVIVALGPDGGVIVSDDKEIERTDGDEKNVPALHFTAGQWRNGEELTFSLVESIATVPDRLREVAPSGPWYYATDQTLSDDVLYFTWDELQNYWTGLRNGEFTLDALLAVHA